MVLESLISVKKAEKQPEDMLPIGITYSSIAIWLAIWLFPGQASSTAILFTVIATLPILLQVFYFEEKKEARTKKISLKTHRQAIPFFIYLFLGLLISFTFWYVVLPEASAAKLFSTQINTISSINSGGNLVLSEKIYSIFFNNFKVLIAAILLSILYGAGSVFIFAWNASVIAVAIGSVIKHAGQTSFPLFAGAFLKYIVHGIPEVTAYFLGGLAGGILSYAIVRHEYGTKKFTHTLLDSLDLIAAAVILLVLAAVIEVFVTPMIS